MIQLRERCADGRGDPYQRSADGKALPPIESLPEKWRAKYRKLLPQAIARYSKEWGGEAECRFVIHTYVVNCWRAEAPKIGQQGQLFA